MSEGAIQRAILAVLNHPESPCRLWRNNVGSLPLPNGPGRLTYGLGVGSADLVGLVKETGQFIAVEVKTPVGRLSRDQKAWLESIRRFNGLAFVLRSVEEARAVVETLRKG